jgi:putative transposase
MNPKKRTKRRGSGFTKSKPQKGREPGRQATRRRVPARRRRYTPEQRELALTLISAGMPYDRVSAQVGACPETLRLWRKRAEASGTAPASPTKALALRSRGNAPPAASAAAGERLTPLALARARKVISHVAVETSDDTNVVENPRDCAYGLSEDEQREILKYKKEHPSMGPAQLRAQLKRFKGWRISVKAIGSFLKAQGYDLVHRGSRPEGEELIRFEAPRPNALWQLDFAELRLPGVKLHLLVIIDDFSRFIVGHAVAESPESTVATQTLRQAMARHGKPEAVRTDRGGAFLARRGPDAFARVLEQELITHHVGRPYHPQGGGKVESVIGTVRRELWDIEEFATGPQAEARLASWMGEYNHRRAHMGLDGLTPADRYFGRSTQVLEAINAASRQRQGRIAQQLAAGTPVEEVLGLVPDAPLEVLRLVVVDGALELRFCGARVRLGPLVL